MEPSFERLLVELADGGVRFLLVGGLAVALNGYVRLTDDVDILVDLEEDNLRRLIDVLARFGEGHGGAMTPDDITPEPGAVRIVEESENCQLDIFSVLSGSGYGDLIDESEAVDVAGRTIRLASKAQLIRFKSASVREKDQIDVLALRRLLEDPSAFD